MGTFFTSVVATNGDKIYLQYNGIATGSIYDYTEYTGRYKFTLLDFNTKTPTATISKIPLNNTGTSTDEIYITGDSIIFNKTNWYSIRFRATVEKTTANPSELFAWFVLNGVDAGGSIEFKTDKEGSSSLDYVNYFHIKAGDIISFKYVLASGGDTFFQSSNPGGGVPPSCALCIDVVKM
jgi:hypothetical protein